jgi:glutamate-1-semialdehyde 2,1-aminomutase
VATACGLATLKLIQRPGFFEALSAHPQPDGAACTQAAPRRRRAVLVTDCQGGMFGFFFTRHAAAELRQVMAKGSERFNRFFHLMLDRGVYLAPAMYEAGFVSAAHTEQDIADTVAAAAEAFRQL